MSKWLKNLKLKPSDRRPSELESSLSATGEIPLIDLTIPSLGDSGTVLNFAEDSSPPSYAQLSLELDTKTQFSNRQLQSGFKLDGVLRLSRFPLPAVTSIQIRKILLTSVLAMRYPAHTQIAVLITLLDESTQVVLINRTQKIFKITGHVSAEYFPSSVLLTNPDQRVTVTLPTQIGRCMLASLRLRTQQTTLSDNLLPPVHSWEQLLTRRKDLATNGLILSYQQGNFGYYLDLSTFQLKTIVQLMLSILSTSESGETREILRQQDQDSDSE